MQTGSAADAEIAYVQIAATKKGLARSERGSLVVALLLSRRSTTFSGSESPSRDLLAFHEQID